MRPIRRVRIPALTRRYAGILAVPGARSFFFSAAPARVGAAMISLGLLWLVRWGTGSYAAAGAMTGIFAVTSALTSPVLGRLAGRFGQARVLVPTAVLHACAVGGVVVTVVLHYPLWTIAVLVVVAGAALPPVSSLTATRWSVLLAGSSVLPTAFALESLSNELAYLCGPALAGTVSAVAAPAGVLLAGSLVLIGCLALARSRATEPARAEPAAESSRGGVGGFGFVLLALINLGIGCFFGALQVSVTAFATGHGTPGSAGLIYSLLSVTSVLAGFAYGARKWRLPASRQLVLALAMLSVASVPMIFATTPALLAVALLLPGFGLAPSMILVSLSTERIVERAGLTRAFAVLNSAAAVGIALASAVAGRVLDAGGTRWGFAIAACAVGAALIVSVVASRRS